MKRNKCIIDTVGSDTWLKQFEAALKCPSFRYKPHKQQKKPTGTQKQIANIETAQKFKRNY